MFNFLASFIQLVPLILQQFFYLYMCEYVSTQKSAVIAKKISAIPLGSTFAAVQYYLAKATNV